MRIALPVLALLVFVNCGSRSKGFDLDAQPDYEPLSGSALYSHVEFLAADSLKGRLAGSPGEQRAAQYIYSQLIHAGLETGYQSFPFTAGVSLGIGNRLAWSGTASDELVPSIDFRPLPTSAIGAVRGEVVFAGYGQRNDNEVYDDYANVDVDGKVVMVLSPGADFAEADLDNIYRRRQVLAARLQGATALLLINLPPAGMPDMLPPLLASDNGTEDGIPTVLLTRKAADRLLAVEHLSSDQLQGEIDDSRLPISHELRGIIVDLATNLDVVEDSSRNVTAVLPGKGKLADQWIVVGAHYDHLGMGGPGSGSTVPNMLAVHNGADDNASGVAMLLEVARHITENKVRGTRRTIVFQVFGAEEPGLWGSRYAAANPPTEAGVIVAMVNLDMVGRLRNRRLVVEGSNTSSAWEDMVRRANSDNLTLVYGSESAGVSDHQSYFVREKPVLHLTTGEHDQYHTPDDDANTLNYDGMSTVGQLAVRLITDLATRRDPMPVNPVVPDD